jgi:hypothetical protein
MCWPSSELKMETMFLQSILHLATSLHGAITQKKNIDRYCLLSKRPPLDYGELIW